MPPTRHSFILIMMARQRPNANKIKLGKAIEIIDINLKEASKHMPPDLQTTLELCYDELVALVTERTLYGYQRIGQLPHEDTQINWDQSVDPHPTH